MAFDTALTRMFDIEIPIISAPMAMVAGGRLAAAVSNAGGLGLIGGGYGDEAWIEAEQDAAGNAPVGIGFIAWRLPERRVLLTQATARKPRAVFLSFADIAPFAEEVKSSGARLIAQVQSVGQAEAAAAAGADVIVAQGTEAGGHGGARATLPLVPAVVDAVGPIPVLAAGGVADGRGLAAALALGAAGAVVGSAFVAAEEALITTDAKKRLAAASGDHTAKGSEFDRLRGFDWPAGYAIRTLDNPFLQDMRAAPPQDGAALEALRARFDAGRERDDPAIAPVIAGEGADLIRAVEPAGDILRRIATEAETILSNRPGLAR